MSDIVKRQSAESVEQSTANRDELPTVVKSAGSGARFAYEEFLYGQLRNASTRKNYKHAVKCFLHFCEQRQRELSKIMPRDVGEYLDQMPFAAATKKLHLAALRHFFDVLVNRHVILLNPAASVRGPRLQIVEGKTPDIGVKQARRLLQSIKGMDVVSLRDRAIIAVLIYTAVRVSAVAALQVADFFDTGDQYCLRFKEKGGKARQIPCRHDLRHFILEYMTTAEISDAKSPLFRSAVRKTKKLTARAMNSGDMARMMKRRCRRIHMPSGFSPHSFRVTTITDLLEQGVPLEDVQHLAGHADPRTTRLYDRRQRKVTRNIVERISV